MNLRSLNRLTVKDGKATTAVVQPADRVLVSVFNFDTCVSSDGDLSSALTLLRTETTVGNLGQYIKAQFYSASRPGAVVSFALADIGAWIGEKFATYKPAAVNSGFTSIGVSGIAGCDRDGFITMLVDIGVTTTSCSSNCNLQWAVSMAPNAAFNAPAFSFIGQSERYTGGAFEWAPPAWPWTSPAGSSGNRAFGIYSSDFKGNTSYTAICVTSFPTDQSVAGTGAGDKIPKGLDYPNTAAYSSCTVTASACDAEYPNFSAMPCGCSVADAGCCAPGNQLQRPTHMVFGCQLARVDFDKPGAGAYSVAANPATSFYKYEQAGLTSTSKTSWLTPYDNSFVAAPIPYIWETTQWSTAGTLANMGWWIVPTVAPDAVFLAESHVVFKSAPLTTEPLNAGAPIHSIFKIDFAPATPTVTRAIDLNAFRSTLTCGSAGSAGSSVCASGARFTGGGCSRLLWKEVSASCDGGAVCAKVTCDTAAGANWAFGGASPAALYVRVSGVAYGTLDLNDAASGKFTECTCAKLR